MKEARRGGDWSRFGFGLLLAATALTGGCASTGPIVAAPDVRLESVHLGKLGLDGQTFLLEVSLRNPNTFALPVRNVRYELRLDEERFAGGETRTGFVVAPQSETRFAISVQLDLLHSASGFDMLVDGGFGRTVQYELAGSLRLDLPSVAPVPFSESGSVYLGVDDAR